jgi:DNA modification methylase
MTVEIVHADSRDALSRLPGESIYCCCGRHDAWISHFATFPPRLIEPCILAGCPEGGTVLDPFAGGATTGLVADRLQRNAICIELNPYYAAMARRRVEDSRGGLLDIMEGMA